MRRRLLVSKIDGHWRWISIRLRVLQAMRADEEREKQVGDTRGRFHHLASEHFEKRAKGGMRRAIG